MNVKISNMETGQGPIVARDEEGELRQFFNAAHELVKNEEEFNKRKEAYYKNFEWKAKQNSEFTSAIDYDMVFIQAQIIKYEKDHPTKNLFDFLNIL